jgi:DNA polymerase III subunit beta
MKVSILQQDLIGPLQAVTRSVGIRTTLPVLANILISTEENKIKLAATNLEIGVIKKVNAKIDTAGEITVPAKTFLEIISSLPSQEINLETEGEQLKISSKNFNVSLNGISATEFPTIPLASESSVGVSAKLLKESIPQISFAAAADEGRPVLTGILTEITKSTLEVVATDGFRLAHKKVSLQNSKGNSFKSLIPRRTLEEIVRLISEDITVEDGVVEISVSENQNQVVFKIGETQLSSRLIEGNFPVWERIVPTEFKNTAIVDRSELLKALKLASVFARSEANIIKVETQENKLRVTSEAKELGAQEAEVEAELGKEALIVAFNAKYLQDALGAVNTEKIIIEFSGNLSPALIKADGIEGLEYVIMPIRLS